MYILQISDLHLSTESNLGELLNKTNLLCDKINELKNEQNSQIVCCVLGDFVDKGNAQSFDKAVEILQRIKEKLNETFGSDNVKFVLLPGNHDLCAESKKHKTLKAFHDFTAQFLDCRTEDVTNSSIQEIEFFGYSFISINSVFKNQHQYGQIDFETLKEKLKNQYTILLTHHALISSDEEDEASIRNGYALLKLIEENKIIALLHGHTHGCKRYSIGQEQQIIGVGPMFKNVQDISNQCNLIHVAGGKVRRINTLTYHADRLCWDVIETYRRNQDSTYTGSSISEVYSNIMSDADINYFLPNLKIEIKQNFNSLEEEINSKFSDALQQAELWQNEVPADTLDYTHCQLMNTTDMNWEDFVVETLNRNPTSKRAIIPLIDKSMSFKGGDDKLVSFDVVQFGFADDNRNNLNITVYLRALELRYFLPINICETYIMARKLQHHFRNINEVTVCIFAFIGEAKDEYGCYRKSRLDIIFESDICKLYTDKNFKEIEGLLLEKITMSDTVINFDWLTKIKNVIHTYCFESSRDKIKAQIDNVENNLDEYKKVRSCCSSYFLTKKQEDVLKESIFTLARLIGELKGD